MGLLDWLTDNGSSSLFGGMGGVNSPSGVDPDQPPSPPQMPPVQMTGADAPSILPPPQPNPGAMARPVNPAVTDIGGGLPPGATGSPPVPDPSTTDIAGGMQGAGGPPPPLSSQGLPAPPADGGAFMPKPGIPLPQPRPPGAPPPMAMSDTPKTAFTPNPPPNAAPTAGGPPPGPPMNIAPQGLPTGPLPGQTALGRALGIRPDQAGLQGRQIFSGLGAGLKAIGQGAGVGQGKFAAFAGGMGNAMEGANKESQVQQKQATDYLNAAIKSKQQGDEAGYKQNYLQYLAAKLKADTDKAANKDAAGNKNDTPTQLYLSAQRLAQPDRNALNRQLDQMRREGADPAAIDKAKTDGEAAIEARLQQHYATLGIHPQDAAALARAPGNSKENPVDGKAKGLTLENASKFLQPGQYFTNPKDGKVYIYRGPKASGGAAPDKPSSSPEPMDPMKPYKTPAQASADLSEEGDAA